VNQKGKKRFRKEEGDKEEISKIVVNKKAYIGGYKKHKRTNKRRKHKKHKRTNKRRKHKKRRKHRTNKHRRINKIKHTRRRKK